MAKTVGSNAERTRLHNRRVVLDCVRVHEPAGRAEIARQSALSTQGVSNIIAELEAGGFLQPIGRRRVGRGQPPLLTMADPDEAPHKGALLSARIGLGRHTHTSLILHHQMEQLVPGAFSLMANLAAPAPHQ